MLVNNNWSLGADGISIRNELHELIADLRNEYTVDEISLKGTSLETILIVDSQNSTKHIFNSIKTKFIIYEIESILSNNLNLEGSHNKVFNGLYKVAEDEYMLTIGDSDSTFVFNAPNILLSWKGF